MRSILEDFITTATRYYSNASSNNDVVVFAIRNIGVTLSLSRLSIFAIDFFWQFEPYIQSGNEGLVHHMLIYECHGNFNDSHYGPGYDCRDQANMPLGQCYFYSIVAAWAVGGEV